MSRITRRHPPLLRQQEERIGRAVGLDVAKAGGYDEELVGQKCSRGICPSKTENATWLREELMSGFDKAGNRVALSRVREGLEGHEREFRKFVADLWDWHQGQRWPVDVSLKVANSGTASATDVRIRITFPEGVGIFYRESVKLPPILQDKIESILASPIRHRAGLGVPFSVAKHVSKLIEVTASDAGLMTNRLSKLPRPIIDARQLIGKIDMQTGKITIKSGGGSVIYRLERVRHPTN